MQNEYCELPNAYEVFLEAYFKAKDIDRSFLFDYPTLASITDVLIDIIGGLETNYILLDGEKYNSHKLFFEKEENFLRFLGLQYYNYNFELVEPLNPPLFESKQLYFVKRCLNGENE